MNTSITLPPRREGAPITLDTDALRHIVVIGANGAGKTRFADRLAADLGGRSFRLSALKALDTSRQPDSHPAAPGSIADLYHRATADSSLLRSDLGNEFEQTLALLINEELLSLIRHKFSANVHEAKRPPVTRLERVISEWQKVFPDNRVLLENGRMLFSRSNPGEEPSGNNYSASRLSDGEKTVLYYLGAVTFAPRSGVIIVESPDMFLHPSSTASLWNTSRACAPTAPSSM